MVPTREIGHLKVEVALMLPTAAPGVRVALWAAPRMAAVVLTVLVRRTLRRLTAEVWPRIQSWSQTEHQKVGKALKIAMVPTALTTVILDLVTTLTAMALAMVLKVRAKDAQTEMVPTRAVWKAPTRTA